MTSRITRRLFLRDSVIAGTGALMPRLFGELLERGGSRRASFAATTPLIVASHTNETGRRALATGWEILQNGGTALDAVEKATNIIEEDPEDTSVGYGGLPNERGVVQLDASIMDGRTYNAGAVASLENIKHPSSVARLVMERTDHVLLVGPGALEFAKSWGFPEEDLLTDRARQHWLRWREGHSDRDDWGPPDHLRGRGNESGAALPADWTETYGTVNVLAVDANGDIAGITSTSGLSYKIAGRVGDSPIIGAGLYVDNEVGAAGATGRGEDVIKACSTYYIVMRMRDGRSPQEACEDALRYIAERYRAAGIDFMPGEKYVAINKSGEVGCARTNSDNPARMTVASADGIEVFTGTGLF